MSKEPREYLALYESAEGWKLITREVSSYNHALSMAVRYREHGRKVAVICIKEPLEVSLVP